jgi:hypothetical protein
MSGATEKPMILTDDEIKVLRKVLVSDVFQYLIGDEEWDLTEAEENTLWEIIKREGRT